MQKIGIGYRHSTGPRWGPIKFITYKKVIKDH